ncbi:MAG: HAD family hydrolase [Dehalococcoidia bacterium]
MASANGRLNGFDPTQIRAVAFDCYGTLIDFDERAFAPAIDTFLRDRGVNHVPGRDVWAAWMESAREHASRHGRDPEQPLDGPEPPFYSFAEVWPRHFRRAFAATGIEGIDPRAALDYVFALMSRAPVYDEVPQVVAAVRRAGFSIAVASNADDVHLFPALELGGIKAELVVSSENVRSYKPRRPFFDALCEQLGAQHREILYVGDSPYADVRGACNVGMPVYWVRRYRDPEREKLLQGEPTWIFSDLRGLPPLLQGARQ